MLGTSGAHARPGGGRDVRLPRRRDAGRRGGGGGVGTRCRPAARLLPIRLDDGSVRKERRVAG